MSFFNSFVHGGGGGRCTPAPLACFLPFTQIPLGHQYLKMFNLTKLFIADDQIKKKWFYPSQSTYGIWVQEPSMAEMVKYLFK